MDKRLTAPENTIPIFFQYWFNYRIFITTFGFEDLIKLPQDLRNDFVKITDWRLELEEKRLKLTEKLYWI